MRASWMSFAAATVVAASGCSTNTPQVGPRQTVREQASPAVHTVEGRFERIVAVRIQKDQDLLDGLRKAVADRAIKNAVILTGVGSLTAYRVHVVANTTFPVKEAFPAAEGPQDLLNVSGYVIDGRIHAHITFSDQTKAMGGHLEPGTKVFTFAIITLGVLADGTSLARFDDASW